jgi:hypothetical protein
MKQKPRSRVNRKKAKTVLRLPDLEHAPAAVLKSLTSADAQRGYHPNGSDPRLGERAVG